MAIKSFKEIIDNKGYRISKKDRDIFEDGTLQSFFGFSNADLIEFIAYDVNDNQLPLQINPAGDTVLVKYIPLTSENIRNYFLIAEGTKLQLGNFPSEYFIDVKQILNESGYDAGIFKTQVTLLNRRVGDYRKDVNAKLWIKEISPSRTEIKVLPQVNEVASGTDLNVRFGTMVNDRQFRDDTLPFVFQFINQVTPTTIDTFLSDIYTKKWLDKLVAEFGLREFDRFATRVHRKFITAVTNEFSNKISNINDLNFGKSKKVQPPLELSVDTIEKICLKILVDVVDSELPKRKIQNTEIDTELDRSVDRTASILQRRESDLIINANVPQVQVTIEKEKSIKDVQLNTKIDDEVSKIINETDEIIDFIKPNPTPKLPPRPSRGGGGGGGGRGSLERFWEDEFYSDMDSIGFRPDIVDRPTDIRAVR